MLQAMLAGLLLAVTAIPVAAGESPVTLYYRASITIEPDGTLSQLDWQQGGKIPAALRTKLDERVGEWEFQPGTVEGRPARTESTLLLNLLAVPQGNGFVVRVQSAETGAALSHPVPAYPYYPLRSGDEGNVLASLVVDPDGTRHVAIAGYEGSKRYRKDFVSAVEDMFDQAVVSPERVDGHPVAAEFRIPVDFCIDSPGCREHPWPKRDATADGPPATQPGTATPVGSVARLLTEVRGTAI